MRLFLALVAALVFVAACGKKAPLRPPGSERPSKESSAIQGDVAPRAASAVS